MYIQPPIRSSPEKTIFMKLSFHSSTQETGRIELPYKHAPFGRSTFDACAPTPKFRRSIPSDPRSLKETPCCVIFLPLLRILQRVLMSFSLLYNSPLICNANCAFSRKTSIIHQNFRHRNMKWEEDCPICLVAPAHKFFVCFSFSLNNQGI